MNLPVKEALPLKAKENTFRFDDAKVNEFHKAFRDKTPTLPPTLMCVSMKGIFDLLNEFKIDWKKLLHATQSFSYQNSFDIPVDVVAETTLLDIKSRASMIWFQFETRVREATTKKELVICKSLLMTSETP